MRVYRAAMNEFLFFIYLFISNVFFVSKNVDEKGALRGRDVRIDSALVDREHWVLGC